MTIDCRTFAERLDDLLEERLDGTALGETLEHQRVCARCRELREAATGALLDLTIEPPAGLIESVLRRTSGPTCRGALGRLCDFADRTLGRDDEDLVRIHLSACPACAALSRALSTLKTDLPALAEIEPDPAFLGHVLRRTRLLRAGRSGSIRSIPSTGRPGWAARLAAGWRRLAYRPRFAWEGGYVGALFLTLLFGTPGSPLAGIPQEALSLVRTDPIAVVKEAADEVTPQLRSRARSVWSSTRGKVEEATESLAADLSKRSSSIKEFRAKVGTLWDRFTSEDATNDTNRPAESDAGQTEGEK